MNHFAHCNPFVTDASRLGAGSAEGLLSARTTHVRKVSSSAVVQGNRGQLSNNVTPATKQELPLGHQHPSTNLLYPNIHVVIISTLLYHTAYRQLHTRLSALITPLGSFCQLPYFAAFSTLAKSSIRFRFEHKALPQLSGLAPSIKCSST